MSDLGSSSQIRQSFHAPPVTYPPAAINKLRTANVRRGRSHSHADIRLPSKSPSNRQLQPLQQRNSLNGPVDIGDSSVFISPSNDNTKMPASATATALMMINKQYTNNPTSYLPHIINNQNNTKTMSFYQKRYSEQI